MIYGFEKETSPLNDKELELIPGLVISFCRRVGKKRAIQNWQILRTYRKRGYRIDSARLRKMINYIRINNMVPNLVSGNVGYWIEPNPYFVKKYIKSLISRSNAIKTVAIKLGRNL
jgi:hypothetical protein